MGQTVQYRQAVGNGFETHAAIILYLHDEFNVKLVVFDRNGHSYTVESAEQSIEDVPGTWQWV